jgi:hypothetical protein
MMNCVPTLYVDIGEINLFRTQMLQTSANKPNL